MFTQCFELMKHYIAKHYFQSRYFKDVERIKCPFHLHTLKRKLILFWSSNILLGFYFTSRLLHTFYWLLTLNSFFCVLSSVIKIDLRFVSSLVTGCLGEGIIHPKKEDFFFIIIIISQTLQTSRISMSTVQSLLLEWHLLWSALPWVYYVIVQ